ncbi:OmpA family protein [Paracoccus stylophorae]|uniref:OmpA family protein n=1 Tax=Paracoccus stylophorae TaxID=659350 RepID=A0ABY7SST6_9RHOB|nr:OmpA family protein [Paracoccus stylophorae]WCR10070.1 OmpA family protein [Paracoccus stylophorae]
MRRIISNTTAIAACLSMVLPQLATANTALPADPPVAQDAVIMAQDDVSRDDLGKLIQEKLLNAQKEAEKKAGKAKDAAKDAAKKADKKDRKADGTRKPAPKKQKNADKKDAAKNDAVKKDAVKKGAVKKDGGQKKTVEKDRPKKAERKAQDQKKATPAKGDQPAGKPKKAKDAQIRKDDRKPQPKKADSKPVKKPQAASAPFRRATSDTANERAMRMMRLSDVLDREIAQGLDEGRLRCMSGGKLPCKEGERRVTPRGVVVERNRNGAYLLAPGSAQMYRVDGDGKLVARAPEEDQRETRAGQDAAHETGAGKADALDDTQKRQNVREERITEAGRRSSAEDFATSLRDALTGRGDDRKPAASGKEDNDLVKALLLGAGALAVGSMLNNNRQVALSTPDRVVLTRDDGSQEVVKDETALLRQPGATVATENFDDGSSRTIVTRPDGSKVVTIRDAGLRVLRRTLISADGRTTRLIDDTETVAPVDISSLPAPAPVFNDGTSLDQAALREALQREAGIDRRFTLGQIRNIPEVRSLVAPINIDAITFDTGSAAIRPDQAEKLSGLGQAIRETIAGNPREMFLIEGYTDTVGSDSMNLALSDRRAESVALALSEYFDVPPENLIVQGYGEQFLKVRSEGDIRANRRVSVRRITDLLKTAEAS